MSRLSPNSGGTNGDCNGDMAIALRYMATGDSFKSLQYGFHVAYNTICLLIAEVTSAIMDSYHEEVIITPTTPDDWMVIANTNSRK